MSMRKNSSTASVSLKHALSKSEATENRVPKRSHGLLVDPKSTWCKWFAYYMAVIAIFAAFFQPYLLGFKSSPVVLDEFSTWTALYLLISISNFLALALNFFMMYEDEETGGYMTRMSQIATYYVTRGTFVLDVVSGFPLHWLIVEVAGASQVDWINLQYLELICLVQLVQLYRIVDLVKQADEAMIVSQTTVVISRNYAGVMLVSHVAACVFWFIAKMELFGPTSWVGRNYERFDGENLAVQYSFTLYFTISIFSGLGDNDLFPTTLGECIFCAFYMLVNIFVSSYILGTVTMLVVTADERSKEFRRRVSSLREFSENHDIPQSLYKAMLNHLNVNFQVEHTSDEAVLGIYPTTVRRKVLRHLYARTIRDCYLFRRCKPRFLDAFMAAARVELFMPNVQVITEGDHVNELHIVVEGDVVCGQGDISSLVYGAGISQHGSGHSMGAASLSVGGAPGSFSNPTKVGMGYSSLTRYESSGGPQNDSANNSVAIDGSSHNEVVGRSFRGKSQPFAEISFFAETPSDEGVYSANVVQVLVLSKTSWDTLMEQFPQQARLVLENLQLNLEENLRLEIQQAAQRSTLTEDQVNMALKLISASTSGQVVDPKLLIAARDGLTAVQLKRLSRLDDLQMVVAKHVRKVDQMRVFEFLNVAANGDVEGVRQMMSLGMTPDTADYDGRTALMLAAGGGHEALVRVLLESGADHALQDKFGNTAMMEAIKKCHDNVIDVLLAFGAVLGMEAYDIAGQMCNAVSMGDLAMLKRFLRAGAPPNAADYDQRCALHIAGAEGSLAATKVLLEEGGADVLFKDRWGNTALDEALRINASNVISYLEGHTNKAAVGMSKAKRRMGIMKDILTSCSSNNSPRLSHVLSSSAPPCIGLALMTSASHGNMDCLNTVLEWKGSKSLLRLYGPAALVEAAFCGQISVVERLMRLGVRVADAAEHSMVEGLMESLRCDDLAILRCLLFVGVNPNSPLGDGSTPVHYAAVSNKLEELRTLVEVGRASVTQVDSLGRTPLDAVLQDNSTCNTYKNADVISYLRWLMMPGNDANMADTIFGSLLDPRQTTPGDSRDLSPKTMPRGPCLSENGEHLIGQLGQQKKSGRKGRRLSACFEKGDMADGHFGRGLEELISEITDNMPPEYHARNSHGSWINPPAPNVPVSEPFPMPAEMPELPGAVQLPQPRLGLNGKSNSELELRTVVSGLGRLTRSGTSYGSFRAVTGELEKPEPVLISEDVLTRVDHSSMPPVPSPRSIRSQRNLQPQKTLPDLMTSRSGSRSSRRGSLALNRAPETGEIGEGQQVWPDNLRFNSVMEAEETSVDARSASISSREVLASRLSHSSLQNPSPPIPTESIRSLGSVLISLPMPGVNFQRGQTGGGGIKSASVKEPGSESLTESLSLQPTSKSVT